MLCNHAILRDLTVSCLPEVLADMEETIEDETCLIDELEVTVADPGSKVWNEFCKNISYETPSTVDSTPRFTAHCIHIQNVL